MVVKFLIVIHIVWVAIAVAIVIDDYKIKQKANKKSRIFNPRPESSR